MNLVISIFGALLAAIPLVLAGYLIGVRRGAETRTALRSELAQLQATLAACEGELRRYQELLLAAQQQMASRSPESEAGAAKGEPLKSQIDASIRNVLQPLLAREQQTRELRDAVNGLLGPMVERERLGLELARLDAGSGKGGLAPLLTAMAKRAGFSTVLVTDDNGLPMGQNDGAKQVELLSATLGMILHMVDRISRAGGSIPLAVVLRDTENQVALHRMFKVDNRRYVVTATAAGGLLTPDLLDPTLARIERVLTTRS
jgi:hypothetical protein